MYEAYFGLHRRPFAHTPNPEDYFPAAAHEDAHTLLQCFLADGDGFALVLGAAGSGKTLLGHRLLDSLQAEHQPIFLTNSHAQSVAGLFQTILYDLSLPYVGLTEAELRLNVTDFLMQRFAEGDRTLLLVDEAQHLTAEQLEELRLLTNLESRRRKALQVVLLAQPRLAHAIDRPELEPLAQRIAVSVRLAPFTQDETAEYIHTQMERAGDAGGSVFSAESIAEIFEHSGGVPRRINQIAHRAMLLAFAQQIGSIDADLVALAAEQMVHPRPRRTTTVHHPEAHLVERPAPTPRASAAAPTEDAEPHVIEVGAERETHHSESTVHFAPFGMPPTAPRRA
jgi:general secretion pathway protein A